MSDQADTSAVNPSIVDYEVMYRRARQGIAYALQSYAGHTTGGSFTDTEAWRGAEFTELLDHMANYLRFDIGAAVREQSIDDSVRWIQANSSCWPTAPCWVKSQATTAPTVADVQRDPAYYISGPGHEAAEKVTCPHGYRLTDSCPNCGEEDAPDAYAAPQALPEGA